MISPLRRLAGRRPAAAWVVAEHAAPFSGGAGPVGVLLCHGFSGSPYSMRPWADALVAAGLRVEVPRLPGHGTDWRELNRTAWGEWYAEVDRAFTELAAECEQVFVGGLSLGGALALRLAEQHGDAVAGLMLVNPCINSTDPRMRALPVLRRLTPSLAALGNDIAKPGVDERAYARTPLHGLASAKRMWAEVRRDLGQVRQPLLVATSTVDHIVDPSSLRILRERVSSTDVSYLTLPRSYHVATLDHDADDLFAASVAFVERVAKDSHDPTGR